VLESLTSAISRLEAHLTESKKEKVGDAETRLGEDLYDQMVAIEPPPVEYVTTPKEQVLMTQWEKRVMGKLQQRAKSTYETSYVNTLNTLKEDGGELHEEVVRLITTNTPYNVTQGTNRGDIDARLNYQKALNAILSGKVKAANVGTASSPKGTGVTAQSVSSTTGKKAPNLTAEAQDLARHYGYTDDQIAEAMDRPIASK